MTYPAAQKLLKDTLGAGYREAGWKAALDAILHAE
jgi:hypothetical protein